MWIINISFILIEGEKMILHSIKKRKQIALIFLAMIDIILLNFVIKIKILWNKQSQGFFFLN